MNSTTPALPSTASTVVMGGGDDID
jgi:hypothetical protein